MNTCFKKYWLIFFLAIFAIPASAQKIKPLAYTDEGDYYVKPGDAIIYAGFIARNQTWINRGCPQFIVMKDQKTKELFSIEVTNSLKNKPSIFSFHIKPGSYEIICYQWLAGKWYGAKVFTEHVYKNIDVTDSTTIKNIKGGILKINDFKRFKFTVQDEQLQYLGTWDFFTGLASFTDLKAEADKKIKKYFLGLDFATAITVIPD